jgi:FtsP/CotA-like multicopper oxidase with cupredoxin domain
VTHVRGPDPEIGAINMNIVRGVFLQRRAFLRGAVGAVLGALGIRSLAAADERSPSADRDPKAPSSIAGADAATPPGQRAQSGAPGSRADFLPVQTLDIPTLAFELDREVKVFRLVAEPVKREFLPGRVFDVWGYNGSVPGPTIEVRQGDRVRIVFENRLPEPTTVHWHGLEVPIEMDGVPAISQPNVEPGDRFTYEFTVHQHGTFFYHSHGAMQEMLGMLGLFIIHPREPYRPRVDKDFGIVLQEWAVLPNNTIPNTLSMEFNWLTFNGKAGPAATPMLVKLGERVRIRMVNIGMDHHPIHLHGHQFYLTGTEGGRIPESLWYPENTVLVGVAQARVIEFEAKYPGDWMFHCHLPHHMMNQMVSMVGPIAHAGHGVQTGGGMEEGMGIVRQGNALSEELGPRFGRGMGLAASERPVSALAGQPPVAPSGGHAQHAVPAVRGGNKRVPGFPQDMFMVMDDEVAKPETDGLAPGWTGAMQGMMTVVRVLPPDRYEAIMQRVREARVEPPHEAPAETPHAGHGDGHGR